jgi:Protein of unknown function (DUF3307)
MEKILILLALFQVKHWYIDFVNQNDEEVKHKGIFFHWLGVKHSLKQGMGTLGMFLIWMLLIELPIGPHMPYVLALSAVDFILHYVIDWTKMNHGNRDIMNPQFWNHLGMDQMAHQLTYIGIAYFVMR